MTIGDEWPNGTSRVQAAVEAEISTGRLASGAAPEPLGPRKRGQSSAGAAPAASKTSAQETKATTLRRFTAFSSGHGTVGYRGYCNPNPGSRQPPKPRLSRL